MTLYSIADDVCVVAVPSALIELCPSWVMTEA